MFSVITRRMKNSLPAWWSKVNCHQAAQRLFGWQVFQVQLRLDAAHAPVGVFQHRDVQAFLAAEVVVDHALAGARGGGDLVDARAAEALAGELLGCHLKDLRHGAGRVVGAAGLARRALFGGRPRRAGAPVWTGSFMTSV
jgi:hypothetical protein